MDKKVAWDFAVGLQKVDDKEISPELQSMIEDEIAGKITTEEIITALKKQYKEE